MGVGERERRGKEEEGGGERELIPSPSSPLRAEDDQQQKSQAETAAGCQQRGWAEAPRGAAAPTEEVRGQHVEALRWGTAAQPPTPELPGGLKEGFGCPAWKRTAAGLLSLPFSQDWGRALSSSGLGLGPPPWAHLELHELPDLPLVMSLEHQTRNLDD
ncbi:PREDICTED: small integral membrane protein 5 isoform X1 [Rhinopithecus bieti]|uniref:small integral membrane protein 5 isoform X1 n=1 Tax=Rhinopithecus bieti TaxID=61621 RepID=UPI00083BC64E|nr:PREDICTED: small integral membrane protein 5 isoform X1 [Rhinopithecus bieti]